MAMRGEKLLYSSQWTLVLIGQNIMKNLESIRTVGLMARQVVAAAFIPIEALTCCAQVIILFHPSPAWNWPVAFSHRLISATEVSFTTDMWPFLGMCAMLDTHFRLSEAALPPERKVRLPCFVSCAVSSTWHTRRGGTALSTCTFSLDNNALCKV